VMWWIVGRLRLRCETAGSAAAAPAWRVAGDGGNLVPRRAAV